MIAPLVRVALRWLGGFLVAKGYLTDPAALQDPELVTVVTFAAAGLCGAISEGWWWLARRRGWAR